MAAERPPPLKPQFEPLGEAALLLRFGEAANLELSQRLQALAASLRTAPPQGVLELVPSYAALAVHFDPLRVALDEVAAWVRSVLREGGNGPARRPVGRIEIPVCYGGDYGPDLGALAAHCRLSEDEIITRHSAPDYVVAMIGFLPGFPYLLGLDPALAMPRMDTPRAEVRAGSVGIGGVQTGIYPQRSPGGWRLIGRTPESLFDPLRDPPSLLQPGDRVRFVPVSPQEFKTLAREVSPA
jgi:KipI family sensor histidine kinase inhibitor